MEWGLKRDAIACPFSEGAAPRQPASEFRSAEHGKGLS